MNLLRNSLIALVLGTGLLVSCTSKNENIMDTQKLQQVWDRQEIEQLMYRHARSLDRMDGELMKSTYWPEGIEEHQDPIFPELFQWNDNAHEFVPKAMEGFANIKITQHRISNILIELDGNKANAETYVWAYHVHTDENGVNHEGILGGRHHFKLERRGDEWKILHRSTVFDWNQNQKATAIWSDKFSEKYKPRRGDKKDDSYNYLKQ
jgi:3-phenylpropionate/cinnamic acid dioxygenase small subunit